MDRTTSIHINAASQSLELYADAVLQSRFVVSTAKNGLGERMGSECTPRGRHVVRACIGAGEPLGRVFVGRRPTAAVFSSEWAAKEPGRDWILTRILWLGGLEPGKNRFGDVDTQSRYIYIHGTSDEAQLGTPCSHGCIRLANADMLTLFEAVQPGTRVLITE